MSKTPFELRFDTLNFARNHLIDEYAAKSSILNYVDGAARDAIINNLAYPSIDAVFELAERFKSFVNDQDTKAKLQPLAQRIVEHSGAVLSEESFKRIFPDVPYTQPGLLLYGDKPFTFEDTRILGAYRSLDDVIDAAPSEGRVFTDTGLGKEVEEMERLRAIVKPAMEAKIVCLYEVKS